MIMKKMIINKFHLATLHADCYIYLLPIRLLYVYNLIKTYLSFDSKNKYVNNTLGVLYYIMLGLTICCPFLFISFIFAININVLNIFDDCFIFIDGNPSGNSFGGSSGFGGPGSS